LRLAQADGSVAIEDPEGGGYYETAGGPKGVKRAPAPDEHFYGLGEKTGALDKRGVAVQMRNTDAYQDALAAGRRLRPALPVIPFSSVSSAALHTACSPTTPIARASTWRRGHHPRLRQRRGRRHRPVRLRRLD